MSSHSSSSKGKGAVRNNRTPSPSVRNPSQRPLAGNSAQMPPPPLPTAYQSRNAPVEMQTSQLIPANPSTSAISLAGPATSATLTGSTFSPAEQVILHYEYFRCTVHRDLAVHPDHREIPFLVETALAANLARRFGRDTQFYELQDIRDEILNLKSRGVLPINIKLPGQYDESELSEMHDMLNKNVAKRQVRTNVIKAFLVKSRGKDTNKWGDRAQIEFMQRMRWSITGDFLSSNHHPWEKVNIARSFLWIEAWVKYFSFAHWTVDLRIDCLNAFNFRESNGDRKYSNLQVKNMLQSHPKHRGHMVRIGAIANILFHAHWAGDLNSWLPGADAFVRYYMSKGDGYKPVIQIEEMPSVVPNEPTIWRVTKVQVSDGVDAKA